MGKGKGVLSYWVVVVCLGCIMFEVDGVFYEIVKEVFCLVVQKFLVKCKFVVCNDYVILVVK